MPVNKNIGTLWFKTQEEIDAYDDKMMSNIELKETEDYDKPSFTILATREKKERFFEISEKGQESINNLKKLIQSQEMDYGSYKHWKDFTLHKRMLYYVTGYLVLRELPIRRFYARSIIMAAYFFNLRNQIAMPTISKPSKTNFIVQHDSNFFKKYLQYDNYRTYYNPKMITKEGISAHSLWKLNQPGFMNIGETDIGKVPYFRKKLNETFWDGTMNQPILPLADKLHRDVSSYYFV